MTDLGEIHWILNMEVTCDHQRRTISLSQSQYIENILERHGMAKCKPVSTPMEVNLKLKKLDADEMNTTEYQQLIGSLMYGSIGTRFDITYDVGVLLCYNHSPGNQYHMCYDFRIYQATSLYSRSVLSEVAIFNSRKFKF